MTIAKTFETLFGARPSVTNFTPGRVNLIGEHTDYNGGMVLPTALSLGIHAALSPRSDDKIRIHSDKFGDTIECHLTDTASDEWHDYALGAIIYANQVGFLQGGADIALQTDLPFGAGLSSSSALTVGLLKLACECGGNAIDNVEIAQLARKIENEFIGMPCGIMDQMAVAIARPGQALALDTNDLSYDLITLPDNYYMAIIHSGQYRRNADGHYKARKEECDQAKIAAGHDNLCLLSDAEFGGLSGISDTALRRARHCMTEHRRTKRAAKALKSADIAQFGALMNESHISMRDDFEMSLPPIDALVADAVRFGAIGARLTGGGFGGCIVACVEKSKLDNWTKQLLGAHPEAFHVA